MVEDKQELIQEEKPRLYLNMILKDDEPVKLVRRSIDSVLPYVDGAYIVVTYSDNPPGVDSPLIKLLQKYKINFSFFKWIDDFSAARNYAMSLVPVSPLDFIYWHDADDVLDGGQHLRHILEEAYKYNWAAVFFHYWYQVELDDNGNVREVLVDHKRERIIRNDHTFKWLNMLHEILVEQRQENVTKIGRDECRVIHLSSAKRTDANIERNIRILEKQANKEQHKDPRTLIYLAKAYTDRGKMASDPARRKIDFDLAVTLFHEYLEGFGKPGKPGYSEASGWPEERAGAWKHVGEIAILSGNVDIAIAAYQSAIDEAPQFPDYYIDLAMAYTMKKEFGKAKQWLMLGTATPMPDTTLITTPKDLKIRSLEVDYQINMHEMKLKEATEDVELSLQLDPKNQIFIERKKMLDNVIKSNKTAQSFVYIGKYLELIGEKEKIPNLLTAIPKDLQQERFVSEMRHLFTPERVWEDNEIAILCGPGFEEWSPKSLETGLGGSEEAVVYLSRELTKLGWKVTVYANPGKETGNHDGVEYRPYFDLNPKDEFNALILWRGVGFVDFHPKARFTMLWLHDVPNNPDFTEERVNSIDKIAVLSEFHKSLLRVLNKDGDFKPIPDEKVFLTANGLQLTVNSKLKRNSNQMIYFSSPDRGLIYLVNMWPEIKKAVPEATLKVFYGFDVFDAMYRDNPGKQAWKNAMLQALKQPGITYGGRIGHQQLHDEISQSALWTYPSDFDEISCISGMKAQALGAVPVCTTKAALAETVKNGVKVDVDIRSSEGQEAYKNALIDILKNPKQQDEIRKTMMPWAQSYFTWENVAKQWDQLLRMKVQNSLKGKEVEKDAN